MTFRDFCDIIDRRFEEQQEGEAWELKRRGEIAFALLAEQGPGVAARVQGTPVDPSEDDAALPAFLAYIAARW